MTMSVPLHLSPAYLSHVSVCVCLCNNKRQMTNGCHFNKNNIIVFADLIDFKLIRSEARMKKDLNRMKKNIIKLKMEQQFCYLPFS